MTRVHTIPFHIGDFLSGTMHMDATEIGAYWMLCLAHYQIGEQGLPDDDIKLARIAKVSTKVWKRIKPTIAEKFTISDSFWRHSKIVDVLRKVSEVSAQNSAKALKQHRVDHATAQPQLSNPISNIHKPTPNPPSPPLEREPDQPDKGAGVLACRPEGGGEFSEQKPNGSANGWKPLGGSVAAGNGKFSIDAVLGETGHRDARTAAPGWDIRHLMTVYDQGINSGTRDPPRYPNKAFPKWCGLYTKGKPP